MRHTRRSPLPWFAVPRTSLSRLATAVVLAATVVLARASAAQGQASPLIVELRGGATAPVLSFRDGDRPGEGVGTGASFSVELALAQGSRESLTFGFSQHRFECEAVGCEGGERYVATGLNLGGRINLRTTGAVVPWVRLAGRTVRVELPERGARPAGTSELGFGGEVGAGLYIGAFGDVALNPGVRFTATNTELPGGELLRLRHVVVDVGLALAF